MKAVLDLPGFDYLNYFLLIVLLLLRVIYVCERRIAFSNSVVLYISLWMSLLPSPIYSV